jgi:GNAT superfamily N-acetyltransferase
VSGLSIRTGARSHTGLQEERSRAEQVSNAASPFAPELESCLAELNNKYWALFRLDWSEDSSNRAILNKLFDTTFDEDIFPEAWLLANLVVHRDYQRQGIGTLLLKWGLDQAQAEKVPCGVESSFAGLRLYEKMGFRKLRDLRYGEKEKETMPEMVWEPCGMKGHWFDRAKAALDAKGV